MHLMSIRIFLVIIILIIFCSSPLDAAAERRTALVIGNSAYSSGPLKNPVNDATDIAAVLKKLGFKVILKTNASKKDMGKAIDNFGKQLKGKDAGLFYYAGHGVQVNGMNYLIPIGSEINEDSDVEYEAIDAGRILAAMNNARSKINIVILDACRDNPYTKSFRSATRGLAIVSKAPTGTIISYSTSPGDVALDGKGRNSPYTSALLQYMEEPGLGIEQMFKKVRASIIKQTGGKQTPWELSSLHGDFYFVVGTLNKGAVVSDNIADEKKKLEEKQSQLQAVKEEQRQVEVDKQKLAMVAPPIILGPKETRRYGRFIAYSNGTVLDTRTNLMWADKDNYTGISWQDAKKYCETYRGGGYTDWRMPTLDELESLFESGTIGINGYNITRLIELSNCCPWASASSEGAYFRFDGGGRGWTKRPFFTRAYRALPVRSFNMKTDVTMARHLFASPVSELKRDGNFIAYHDGTVLDTSTTLMWAAKDNGYNINWQDAKKYCETYRGGGYTDWRMPTQHELAGLYDRSKTYKSTRGYDVHLTELIRITGIAPWASDTRDSYAALFSFDGGDRNWYHQSYADYSRALPVRSVNSVNIEAPKEVIAKIPIKEEIKSDGRFIAYSDGTVMDTKTGLMWAARDNGSTINWQHAKYYCENYRGGNYTDWRMPTLDELAGLFDESKTNRHGNHVNDLIDIPNWYVWSSETRGSEAAYFTFGYGNRSWYPKSNDTSVRAIPVRSGK
ncbi:MAG: DUF1566 domain-containing protein [Smithella sp.]|nr:DUF1566 domain-containing protein [Smithella sp.]